MARQFVVKGKLSTEVMGWARLGGSIFSFCERNSWFVLELLAKRHVRHAHAKKTTDYMCYICRIHVVVSNI